MGSKLKLQATAKDRISELPNAVLCHILSFLPTKDAVKTTILSTRWKNMWASVATIDLEAGDYPDSVAFMGFVDHVLRFHDSSDIQKFTLHWDLVEDFSCVDSWICAAIRHNVVELDLRLYVNYENDETFELPQSLFMSKTLVVLRLMSNCITCPPPTSEWFPSLKFLDSRIDYPDNESVEKIFTCFPVLEELTIGGNLGEIVLNFNVIVPELRTLEITVSSLDAEQCDYNFFITAPNLESLYLNEFVLSNYSFGHAKSLASAIIDLHYHRAHEHDGFADRATELLAAISHVKHLSLSVHSFQNLKRLDLVLHDCYNWDWINQLLRRTPNMEYLVLDFSRCYEDCSEYEWSRPKFVPICLLSHLKYIFLSRFKGRRVDMEVAKYLLKNSKVLNDMTILLGHDLSCTKEELYKKFCVFQRGSKDCRLEFS